MHELMHGTAASILVLLHVAGTSAFVVPLSAASPAKSLDGMVLTSITTGQGVDLGKALSATALGTKTLLVLGTHAADFNMVEYAQRVRYFLPKLQNKGVLRFMIVVNGKAARYGRSVTDPNGLGCWMGSAQAPALLP
jgi:hypothetical protein